MPQVVILGMHRSGTSVTAGVLNALGVHVGERLLMKGRMNEAHYEDRDFLRINESILRRLGGRWDNPPRYETITNAGARFGPTIAHFIRDKDKRRLWGWKDPRTCLTAALYEPYLTDPRYVQVRRSEDAIVHSLIRRDGRNVEFWRKLHIHYLTSMVKFLQGKRYLTVWYEELTDKSKARNTISAMNAFVKGNGDTVTAMKRIRFVKE